MKSEDSFINIQARMLKLCIEYAKQDVDNIYIYCFYDNKMSYVDFFFKIKGNILGKHEIIENKSDKAQLDALRVLLYNLEKINELYVKNKKEMPREMKIIYNEKTKEIQSTYNYDPSLSLGDAKYAGDLKKEWFEELKNIKE